MHRVLQYRKASNIHYALGLAVLCIETSSTPTNVNGYCDAAFGQKNWVCVKRANMASYGHRS